MALESIAAGRYSSTYNAVDCGITRQGYEITHNTHGELINETDLLARSLMDWVHQGIDVSIMFDSLKTGAGSITPFYPWGTHGVLLTGAAPIGRLASDVASAFVMTVTANTPADTLGPDTLTASKAILPPGSNLRLLYNSRVRYTPVRLAVLPVDAGGGTIRHFVTTGP